MFITRTTLNQYKRIANKIITGYCTYANLPYEEKKKYREIGYNSGIYGWNYTAYFDDETKTLIIDGYRNF